MFPPETRILMVDDYPIVAKKLEEQIREIGITGPYFFSRSGNDAKKIIEEQYAKGMPIDVVFSDWNMPGGSGLELLEFLRSKKEFKNVPFIMITSLSYDEKMMKAIRAGLTNFLPKPWATKDLKERLEDAWKKHFGQKASSRVS